MGAGHFEIRGEHHARVAGSGLMLRWMVAVALVSALVWLTSVIIIYMTYGAER